MLNMSPGHAADRKAGVENSQMPSVLCAHDLCVE
jgi:hypothetical protein